MTSTHADHALKRCPEVSQGRQCILEDGHTSLHRADWGWAAAAPAVAGKTNVETFVLYAGRIGWAIILLVVFAVILMALVNSAAR
jgi:hypothetical protein